MKYYEYTIVGYAGQIHSRYVKILLNPPWGNLHVTVCYYRGAIPSIHANTNTWTHAHTELIPAAIHFQMVMWGNYEPKHPNHKSFNRDWLIFQSYIHMHTCIHTSEIMAFVFWICCACKWQKNFEKMWKVCVCVCMCKRERERVQCDDWVEIFSVEWISARNRSKIGRRSKCVNQHLTQVCVCEWVQMCACSWGCSDG